MRAEGGRRVLQGSKEDGADRFLVTVITVAFNAREHLPALFDSILKPKPQDVELIVLDGGSTDGTVELLESLGTQIDYWRSEPDKGIYDAMNTAIALARGSFLLHLNAGDRLVCIPYDELRTALKDGVDLMSFPVELDRGGPFFPSYNQALRYNNTLHHQGTFYRRETFLAYDLNLAIFADFDVNQRLALRGSKGRIGDTKVAWHDRSGVSAHKNQRAIAEFLSVVRKNHGDWAVLIARAWGKWRGLKAKLLRD